MIGRLLEPELTELIHRREFNPLREILSRFPLEDIAEILTDLAAEDRAVLLRILPQQLAADVFEQLGVEEQERLLLALGNEQVARILNAMEPDDRTALLEELPASALVLALFIPLIISSGGNSGAQASTLIIRAMATREVQLGDWLRVFRREAAMGLALGGVLALIGFLRLAFGTGRRRFRELKFALATPSHDSESWLLPNAPPVGASPRRRRKSLASSRPSASTRPD